MIERSDLTPWLIAWIAIMAFVLWGQRKDGRGAGLVISYVLQLWVIHWLAASIYALPWYWLPDPPMMEGLKQSTIAIAGFAVGSTVILPFLVRHGQDDHVPAMSRSVTDPGPLHVYLAIGVVLYFFVDPALHSVPTLGGLASTASNLLLVALGMECWNGFNSVGRHRAFWRWLMLTALLPFVTILTKGYLGYGFAAMLTVIAFVASFYRPRWHMVALCTVVGYLALSMYVTYMRDRVEIRSVVWGQESYSTRISTVANTFSHFEFLNLGNPEHLDRIDDRLNQNELVGLAVIHLNFRPDLFAHGRTIRDAMEALVPRVIWPDRQVEAGSGNLVSTFTGLRFSEDTSVGIGHVMEWYVNFGSLGVFFGMLGLGVLIAWIDHRAIRDLLLGNWSGFVLWWLPGLSLLQVGGSLVEAVSGAAAGLVVALLLNHFGPSRLRRMPIEEAPIDSQFGEMASE
jgi:hypothetical protein